MIRGLRVEARKCSSQPSVYANREPDCRKIGFRATVSDMATVMPNPKPGEPQPYCLLTSWLLACDRGPYSHRMSEHVGICFGKLLSSQESPVSDFARPEMYTRPPLNGRYRRALSAVRSNVTPPYLRQMAPSWRPQIPFTALHLLESAPQERFTGAERLAQRTKTQNAGPG